MYKRRDIGILNATEDPCSSRKKKENKTGNKVHTNRTSHYGNNRQTKKKKTAITSTKIDISLQLNERNGIEQNDLTQYKK